MRVFALLIALFLTGADFQAPNNFRTFQVEKVHDGDTLTAVIELGDGTGLSLKLRSSCRLIGINARELSAAGGPADRDYLKGLLRDYGGPADIIELCGKDKYGRLLVRIFIKDAEGVFFCVNQQMLDEKHAVPMKE